MHLSQTDCIWVEALSEIRKKARADEFEGAATVALPPGLDSTIAAEITLFLTWCEIHAPNALTSHVSTAHLRTMWTHKKLYEHRIKCSAPVSRHQQREQNWERRFAALQRYSGDLTETQFKKLFGVPSDVYNYIFRSVCHLFGPQKHGAGKTITPGARLLLTLSYLRNGET